MNRFLSVAGKVLGAVFLFSGGTVSIAILLGILIGQVTGGVLALLSVLLVLFGLGPASLGGCFLYLALRAERQALRDRFFQLLQVNQGRLSLLDFSTATRLEPAIARRYLDGWAKEFSATFEVSEAGEIYYVFASTVPTLPPNDLWMSLNRLAHRLEGIL
jgi:hypothetical protein